MTKARRALAVAFCAAVIGVFMIFARAQSAGAPVVWVNLTNATASGGSVQHNGGGYFAKAQSQQTVSGPGYFEWTYDGDYYAAGLGNNGDEANNGSAGDLDFAFVYGASASSVEFRRGGAYLGDSGVAAGDVLRIEIAGNGDVIFKKNGTALGTLNNPTKSYPYYLVFKTTESAGRSISNALVFAGSPPAAPTSLAAALATGNDISLSWQRNSANETSIRVERKLGTKGTWSEIASLPAGTNSYLDAGAKQENRPYIYRVRAHNATAYSAYTGEAFAVTPYAGNASIKTDYGAYAPPAPPLPPRGGSFIDETFGSRIIRVTDESDGDGAGTAYSYIPAINSDSTRLLYTVGEGVTGYLTIADFDPATLAITDRRRPPRINVGGLESIPSDWSFWSATDPTKLYSFVNTGWTIASYDTDTNAWTEVVNLRQAGVISAGDTIYHVTASADDDVFTFKVFGPSPGWGWWRASDGQGAKIVRPHVNEPKVSKGRRYVYVVFDCQSLNPCVYHNNSEAYLYDIQTGTAFEMADDAPDYSPGHYDVGTDILVGGDNRIPSLRKRLLSDPRNTQVDLMPAHHEWYNDGHFSLLADNESWTLIGTFNDPALPVASGKFVSEFFQLKNDGSGEVRRLFHNNTILYGGNYNYSTRGSISRDGRFVIFTSNWAGGPGSRGDVFLAKIEPAPSAAPVNWQNTQNTSSTGGTVQHNGGGYFALARSQQQITSGAGYFEFTYDGDYCAVALNAGNDETATGDFSALNYALVFYPSGSYYEIRQSGAYIGDGSAAPGDVFRIAIAANGDVVYYKNGAAVHTVSNPAKAYPYYLVFRTQEAAGNSISNAKAGS